MANWKTTAAGILSALIATLTTIVAFQVPAAVMNPQASRFWLYFTVGANLFVAVARVWVGLLQNDAPPNPPTPAASSGTPVKVPLGIFVAFLPAGLLLAALLSPLALSGCKQQAPPSWATTSPQLATPGEIISGANYAVVGYEKDANAGAPYTQDPTLKAIMSDIQKALTIAQPAFNSWEAALKSNPSAPQPPQLPSALSTIQTSIAKLPAQLQGK